jgi:hypothetical protein
MTPVKVPTAPWANAKAGQETAASNANAPKDGLDILKPPSLVW